MDCRTVQRGPVVWPKRPPERTQLLPAPTPMRTTRPGSARAATTSSTKNRITPVLTAHAVHYSPQLNIAHALVALGLVLSLAASASAQAQPAGGIRGVVVDARDGTPLEKVSVRLRDTKQSTLTGSDGRFHIEQVPAGRHELYVSSVDYILTRRSVDVPTGEIVDITIPISAGTGTYTETVHVTNGAAEDDRGGTLEVLRSNEL